MGDAEPAEDPLVGRTIDGKFEVLSPIGRGGMGAVYRAKQKNLSRHVAIKVLRPDLVSDGAYAARFKREAHAASKLDHPNLMRVHDFGDAPDGFLYIAMELIDGRSLLSLLRDESPLPTHRIVDLASQLLAGLAAMHDERIIHRDLKPENVMVVVGKDDDGRVTEVVKLCDFGIAKQVRATITDSNEPPLTGGATHTATLTATGALVGTPEYMSPEQAKGDVVDARSDLYAVGVILYQLLTGGRLPFKSANSMKVLLAHISEAPSPPSKHASGVDPVLEEICLRALAKAPEDRFESAREMRAALRSVLGLGDSAVRSARVSIAPARPISTPAPRRPSVPPGRDHDPDAPTRDVGLESAPTRKTSEDELAAAIAAEPARESESGVVARRPAKPLASEPPAKATSEPPATQTTPPPSRANTWLVALVVVLLAVIAVLVVKR